MIPVGSQPVNLGFDRQGKTSPGQRGIILGKCIYNRKIQPLRLNERLSKSERRAPWAFDSALIQRAN